MAPTPSLTGFWRFAASSLRGRWVGIVVRLSPQLWHHQIIEHAHWASTEWFSLWPEANILPSLFLLEVWLLPGGLGAGGEEEAGAGSSLPAAVRELDLRVRLFLAGLVCPVGRSSVFGSRSQECLQQHLLGSSGHGGPTGSGPVP